MVELTGNRYLLEMFDNIWNRATSYNLFAAIEKLDLAKSLGDHLRLVDAIETGNPTVAMEAIVDHISRFRAADRGAGKIADGAGQPAVPVFYLTWPQSTT